MRESVFSSMALMPFILTLAGCELVGDIFKAGVWVGVALVIGIVAAVIWFFARG